MNSKREVHYVKSWTLFFKDIIAGIRTSDIRYTGDRRYQIGDWMVLQEWDPVKGEYTGREQLVEITYIQTNKSNPCAISDKALADDYAVFSISVFRDPDKKESTWPYYAYDGEEILKLASYPERHPMHNSL